METTRLRVNLHKPHKNQLAFKRSEAKRRVVVTGRRAGKTIGVSDIAVEAMIRGHRVLEAAPTQDQTETFWEACKKALAEPIAAGLIYKNETRHLLEMPNGARIRAKTAWDADGLRGDYADVLILDEFSLMDPDTWDEVGAPMLLDNDGMAIFIFTPKRRNHAFRLYQRAQADTTGRWEAFHFTSLENPYLSQEALAEISEDMTESAYRQEILAEFLEGEGAVFRNIRACLDGSKARTPDEHQGHRIVFGVDWGRQRDFTVISAVCVNCNCEVMLDRFNQIDYVIQSDRLKVAKERWDPQVILAEANAMGQPIIDQLHHDGLRVQGFDTTQRSKSQIIRAMQVAFEREEVQWIDNPIATGELEAYEERISDRTGFSSFGAPEGLHDDTVMARALALAAANRPTVRLR